MDLEPTMLFLKVTRLYQYQEVEELLKSIQIIETVYYLWKESVINFGLKYTI